MYKIAICDDDQNVIQTLSSMVSAWASEHEYEVEIQPFSSAEEYIFEHDGNNLYDILLLDVEMHTMNGIELAKRIRQSDRRAEIIFVTSHSEYIGEGYEVDALHYLIKPVSSEKLSSVLDKAARQLSQEPESVFISCNGETIKINTDCIHYVESLSHYIIIHTLTGDYKIKENLSVFENKLPKGFFRIHRSYIVYLPKIIRISRTGVTLVGNISLPLSRGLYDAVNRAFIENN